jgi:hypothetical protein
MTLSLKLPFPLELLIHNPRAKTQLPPDLRRQRIGVQIH